MNNEEEPNEQNQAQEQQPEADEQVEKPLSENKDQEEIHNDEAKAAEDAQLYESVLEEWKQNILNEHLIFINGVEIVYNEFKELILELAIRLKDKVESEPGKLKSLLKKFMSGLFMRRLCPFIKYNSTIQ